ncbi:MAG: hypothetical protein IJV07_02855 [Alphaproteobacteria bacterium]|nr:hypothetical protein [Alphaproteobacteria bacterium]
MRRNRENGFFKFAETNPDDKPFIKTTYFPDIRYSTGNPMKYNQDWKDETTYKTTEWYRTVNGKEVKVREVGMDESGLGHELEYDPLTGRELHYYQIQNGKRMGAQLDFSYIGDIRKSTQGPVWDGTEATNYEKAYVGDHKIYQTEIFKQLTIFNRKKKDVCIKRTRFDENGNGVETEYIQTGAEVDFGKREHTYPIRNYKRHGQQIDYYHKGREEIVVPGRIWENGYLQPKGNEIPIYRLNSSFGR